MLDLLAALDTLSVTRTMVGAATRLRLSQSAVSKRIAALEAVVGCRLVEPQGRYVVLTDAARRLLARTRPLAADLAAALRDTREQTGGGRVVIGVAESILCSWGAPLLVSLRRALPEIELQIGAHRTPVAVDHVRAGDYQLALCAGLPRRLPELVVRHLRDEEMVVVAAGSGGRPALAPGTAIPVLTIEAGSATWSSLAPRLRALEKQTGARLVVKETLQSFPCIVALARAGLAHALVPRPLALALGVPEKRLVSLPGLTRPIHLVARKRTLATPLVAKLVKLLVAELPGA